MPSLASFTIADMAVAAVWAAASLLAVYADALVIRDVLAGRSGTLARLALLVDARGTRHLMLRAVIADVLAPSKDDQRRANFLGRSIRKDEASRVPYKGRREDRRRREDNKK